MSAIATPFQPSSCTQRKRRLTLAALTIVPIIFVASPTLGSEIGANVSRLVLTNACSGCNLAGADLSAAHLIGADLRNTNLQGANLSNANLEGADFTRANLTNANLTGAYLTNAVMSSAQLEQVNFTGARLYYVQVDGASVQNIDLTNAQILHTPLSIGGMAPVAPGKRLPAQPIIDPKTFQQDSTAFPENLFLLDKNELIDLPVPLIPIGL